MLYPLPTYYFIHKRNVTMYKFQPAQYMGSQLLERLQYWKKLYSKAKFKWFFQQKRRLCLQPHLT